jgi:hypothetical protein
VAHNPSDPGGSDPEQPGECPHRALDGGVGPRLRLVTVGIMLDAEASMPKRKVKEPSMAVRRLVEAVRREVAARLGPGATFEQRRETSSALLAEALANGLYQDEGEDQTEGHQPPEVTHARQGTRATGRPK